MDWLLGIIWLLVFDFWWLTDCWELWYLCHWVQESTPWIQKLVADVWHSSWLKLTAGNRLCWCPLSENWRSCFLTMKWHRVVAYLASNDRLKNLVVMWNGPCMLLGDLVDSVETIPGRCCVGVLFWCQERHGSLDLSHLSSAYHASCAHQPHSVCMECYKLW